MKILLVIFMVLFFSQAAGAQLMTPPGCQMRTGVRDNLLNNYQEIPRAMGLTNEGAMMELWTSKSGSWTLTITNTLGCIFFVGAGETLEFLPGIELKGGVSL